LAANYSGVAPLSLKANYNQARWMDPPNRWVREKKDW
jgi:hypothetical protein